MDATQITEEQARILVFLREVGERLTDDIAHHMSWSMIDTLRELYTLAAAGLVAFELIFLPDSAFRVWGLLSDPS